MINKNIKNQNKKALGKPLYRIFTTIPSSYDLINHIMTFGMDIRWRKRAAGECLAGSPETVLDICCGTGDMAMTVAGLADNNIKITGLDFSRQMLDIADKKAKKAGYDISFKTGDIAAIPFPSESFDSACIGFGFRNLTYKNAKAALHISEILRVLKPGGRLVIAESSRPSGRAAVIKFFHRIYVRYFVFSLGYLVSGNSEAYRYLAASVINYYSAEELKDLLLKAGFKEVTFRRLFFGAAAIHVAVK